jgi:hypothetical protein
MGAIVPEAARDEGYGGAKCAFVELTGVFVGLSVIDRRGLPDRRQIRSHQDDLYARLEEKRAAVEAERRHQMRRQVEPQTFEPDRRQHDDHPPSPDSEIRPQPDDLEPPL